MDSGRVAYIDLLVKTLEEHEKALDALIGRLTDRLERLDKVLQTNVTATKTMLDYYDRSK